MQGHGKPCEKRVLSGLLVQYEPSRRRELPGANSKPTLRRASRAPNYPPR